MKVRVVAIVTNYLTKEQITIFVQENAKYYILNAPIDPNQARDENVREFSNLSLEDALRMATPVLVEP